MRLFDAFKDKKERTEPIDNAATFSHRHTWVQPDSFRGALTLQPTHKLHWTTAHAHYSAWANYTSNGLCGRNINCQRAGTLQPKQEPLTTHTCPWTHAPNRPTKPHLCLFKSYNQSHPPPPKTHTKNRWIKMSEAVVHIKWATPSSFNKLTSVSEVCNSNHSSSCSPFQESVM